MRITAAHVGLVASVLALGPLAGLSASSAAAGETCHGKVATLVGQPGQALKGTDGSDVVVTNGATGVDVGTGDDDVCVTRGPGGAATLRVVVDAGEGKDFVDSTPEGVDTEVQLGLGDDRFDGGSGVDFLTAYRNPYNFQPSPDGHDTINAGAGDDLIIITAGSGDDSVNLGDGDDSLSSMASPSSSVTVDGGAGRNSFSITAVLEFTGSGRWVFNTRTGLVTEDGISRVTLKNFRDYDLYAFRADRLTFKGSDAPETLNLGCDLSHNTGLLDYALVKMRGGRDEVDVSSFCSLRFDLSGGSGHDSAAVGVVAESLVANLGQHFIHFTDGEERSRAGLSGFEEVSANLADNITLIGDNGPNKLTARNYASAGEGTINRLIGRGGNDVLIGRPKSHSDAIGGPGEDLCQAFHSTACEGTP